MKKVTSYAIIHFENGKTKKQKYETASAAYYDHKDSGCISVDLFNNGGVKLCSINARELSTK